MSSTRRLHHDWTASLLLITALVLVGQAVTAQTNTAATTLPSATGPAFEVATVRPANRDDGPGWVGFRLTTSGRFQTSKVSLNYLVWFAYVGTREKEKVATDHSAPKWVDSDQFDIQAKIDDAYLAGWDKLSDKQRMDAVRPMLRQLLAERFHLKLRTEIQKTPVYALVQTKGGAHVKEVPPPPPVEGDPMEAETRWTADNPGKIYPGSIMCTGDKCTARTVKMSRAVGQIGACAQVDRMVIDETGLTGFYDFTVSTPPDNDETPLQQVEESLGVKFEPRSMPMQTYVIESAQKPGIDGN